MHLARLSLAAIAFAVAAQHAYSQELGDQQKGHNLAQQACAECHAIQSNDLRSPNVNAPSFATIASMPGMTATALNAALNTSHRAMPNVVLNADDGNNIIAYILSLKK